MECFKCNKTNEEVKLLDAVYNDEIVKICEECAINEDIPIIRRPSTSQLKDSEKPYSVRERLRRMAGLVPEEREKAVEIAKRITNVSLDDLRKRNKDKEMEERYELARKRNKPVNLIDNYNWYIAIARRKRKIDRKQLAEAIAESETAIKMIENKEFPDDAERLISKIEQFFDIKLKKEPELYQETKKQLARKEEIKPARILKFDPDSVRNLTIADLQRMKQDKQVKEKTEMQKKMKADELMSEVEKEEEAEKKQKWKEEASENMVDDEIDFE